MIRYGHRESDVWGYTLRKADAFATLAMDRAKIELQAQAVAMRMAQVDGEGFTKYMKTFED